MKLIYGAMRGNGTNERGKKGKGKGGYFGKY